MVTTSQGSETTVVPTIEERIADLPQDVAERARMLQEMKDKLDTDVNLIRRELDRVLKVSIEQNIKPDEKLLADIQGRYELSSDFGINRNDFDIVLEEMRNNQPMLDQVRLAERAFGAEWTVISISESEILFADTIKNTNVEAQEEFLLGLDDQERSDAVVSLQERFPEIERYLQRADDDRGLHYYDYLLVCEITGAEPMSENQYRELQKHKPVDRQKVCWLLTEKEMLDRGDALYGDRLGGGVRVYGGSAVFRNGIRAGRPLLRVQRS